MFYCVKECVIVAADSLSNDFVVVVVVLGPGVA
jgi:hypothetical protein